jgi:hypothetical protein
VADTSTRDRISVVLTLAHRDAILEEVEFAFEAAGDLLFMLERGAESERDRNDARDVVARLDVALGILDQLGWEPEGEREAYVLEVDEGVERFAARIERFALTGLEYNRPRLFAADDRVRETTERLIDTDLEKLRAARKIRTAFKLARGLKVSVTPA